ncbi:carboxymuconolactone decarboxylase family protein [Rhodoblastus sp.]|uniref:carboxymuconolactone decarboxylase family protein n=1 Tax=Rhodoblastus sp. TaxID=1962975 RepID=UPI0025F0DF8D|nr:carboxymuconolactone decarboxylase family protein [Rhodoblastus sp.]
MTTPQGFAENRTERLPKLAEGEMSDAQRAAAEAIVRGPRKAIFGPFIPLLHKPALMERLGDLGAVLRFESGLPERIRELVIAMTARATDNQFEWQTHAPLALKAGVAQTTLDALAARRAPRDLPADEAAALDVVAEILRHNGLSDASFMEAERIFGCSGVVELTVLIGYFATICWVMNIARTPGPGTYPALQATPA